MNNTKARVVVALAVVVAMTQVLLLPAAGQTTFSNSTPITMPALGATVPAPWPGSPYPSTIAVSGLTGTITDVNVVLHGFDCSSRGPDFAYPEDIDIMLVGPTGANAVILSDVGGANQPTALQFTDITITLDDEAAAPLPADTQLAGGTYRPTDDDDDPGEQVAVDTFPAPAPTPSGSTALSVFDDTAPNGTWSLYMADDWAGPNNCTILRGWSLQITTTADASTTTTAPTTTTTAPTTTTTTAPTTTTTTAANRPPVAVNDAYTTPFNTTLTVPAPGVLANDTDPDGDPLTAGMPTNPANGTLNLSTNGGFTYTPNPGFSGTDTFTYMAHDPHGGMTTATVTITVSPGTTTSSTTTTVPTTTTSSTTSSTTTTAPTSTTTTTAPTTTTSTTTTVPTTTTSSTTTTVPTTTTSSTTTTAPTSTTTTTAPTSTTTTTAPTTTTTTTAPTSTTTTTPPGGLTCDGRAATIVGTAGADTIRGTNGPDVIVGLGGDDRIHALGGDDVVCAGAGNDFVQGGEGDDRLFGEAGDDHLVGAGGNDLHHGGAGEDLCSGGAKDSFTACESGFPKQLASTTSGGSRPAPAQVALAGMLILLVAVVWPPARLRGRRLLGKHGS